MNKAGYKKKEKRKDSFSKTNKMHLPEQRMMRKMNLQVISTWIMRSIEVIDWENWTYHTNKFLIWESTEHETLAYKPGLKPTSAISRRHTCIYFGPLNYDQKPIQTGINDNSLRWFKNYLDAWEQNVTTNGTTSIYSPTQDSCTPRINPRLSPHQSIKP